jgi:hypothetical protein
MTSQKNFFFPGTSWPQKFCGVLWRFVAFCGFLWHVAFWGFLWCFT